MPSAGKRARAEAAFAIYAGLGAGRSLRRIQEMQVLLGVMKPYALSTLESYSREFDWQRRVQDFDAKAAAAAAASLEEDAVVMHQRQAQAGALAQQIAVAGLEAFESDPALLQEEGVAALSLLLERGAKLERLARGAATDRPEVVGDVMRSMIVAMIDLFTTVNDLDDRVERAQKFATEADAIVDAQVARLALPVPDEMPA